MYSHRDINITKLSNYQDIPMKINHFFFSFFILLLPIIIFPAEPPVDCEKLALHIKSRMDKDNKQPGSSYFSESKSRVNLVGNGLKSISIIEKRCRDVNPWEYSVVANNVARLKLYEAALDHCVKKTSICSPLVNEVIQRIQIDQVDLSRCVEASKLGQQERVEKKRERANFDKYIQQHGAQ